MRLKDKVAVVTGGASGIGRATAELFAREAAHVIVIDQNAEAAQAVAASLPVPALAIQADISSDEQVAAAFKTIAARFGRVDVLVNNAGYGFTGTVESIAPMQWNKLIEVNLGGVFLCSKYAIALMAAHGGGAIVNMGSYTAMAGIGNRAAYVASKGAIVSLTRSMAIDHAGQNIRVNCVAPGTINSPYFDAMMAASDDPAALRASLNARAPMGRMGEPHEIAAAVLWLASDEASFATGSVLTVDGGSSAW